MNAIKSLIYGVKQGPNHHAKMFPSWAADAWASGAGDYACANDKDLPISESTRLFWHIRGAVLQWIFGWWWWRY